MLEEADTVPKFDLVIKNGTIVTENHIAKTDLAISKRKIVKIASNIPIELAKQHYDAANLHILPGVIDIHVHLNEPGRTDWEGICSGTKSLAAGGVTTYFDMPLNSSPPTTSPTAFYEKKRLATEKSLINYRFWGGLVPDNLLQLEALSECGVVGFKAFMSGSGIAEFPAADDETLRIGMGKIAELKMILALHAESEKIIKPLSEKWASGSGGMTGYGYSKSRPIISEIRAVQKVIDLAKQTGCMLHIVHASSSSVVDIVHKAKSVGVNITVETCPHYLSLTFDEMTGLGGIAKCAPPLRNQHEVELLWESIKRNEIDMIGSDHSPAPLAMKLGNLNEAWGGISGAQTTLNILLEEGYWKRQLPLEMIVKLTSSNPAKRFNLYPAKGTIKVDSDADLTLIDLQKAFILQKKDLFYRHPHSPFIGKRFRGKVVSTFVEGRCVYDDM